MVREDELRNGMLFKLGVILSVSDIPPPPLSSTLNSSMPPLEEILTTLSSYLLHLPDGPLTVRQRNSIIRLLREGLVDLLMRIIIEFSAWDASFAPAEFMVRLPRFLNLQRILFPEDCSMWR